MYLALLNKLEVQFLSQQLSRNLHEINEPMPHMVG
jgi:hypothetical protein